MRSFIALFLLSPVLLLAETARADGPSGAPPPDAKALVDAPKPVGDAPKTETPTDDTNATVSAGGQYATGNSQLLAATVNGKFEMRRGANGFGAALLGNYGQGAPAGADVHVTAENLQGRLRYDRYLIDKLSLFLIATGRHDRFQGLDFRFNLDPGVKYLFIANDDTTLWGEAGYDFQQDVRRDDSRQLNAAGVFDPTVPQAKKYEYDHSARLFAGFKHAFNKEVTFVTGLEYLQSLIHSNQSRINFDALFAASVGGGFSVGLGFSARYDNAPLPGKVNTDTATTFNLIYSFSDVAAPPPAPPPVCPEPPPPPPAAAPAAPPPAPPPVAPAPATAPPTP